MKAQKIFSSDKKSFVEVHLSPSGYYFLERYKICYDEEEKVYYVVKELPNPSGMYDTQISAEKDAERLLNL